MKLNEIEKSYIRSLNQNYLVLNKCCFFGNTDIQMEDYQVSMIKKNKIKGLVVMSQRTVNNERKYYYDINSLVPLSQLFERRQIRYSELERIISSCVNTINQLEDYLIDQNQVILNPEYIYINTMDYSANLILFPDYDADIKLSFSELFDFIISRLDHNDDNAVNLGYSMYRYTRGTNYCISDMKNMVTGIVNVNHNDNPSSQQYVVNTNQYQHSNTYQNTNQYLVTSEQVDYCSQNTVLIPSVNTNNDVMDTYSEASREESNNMCVYQPEYEDDIYIESEVVEKKSNKNILLISILLSILVIMGTIKICGGNMNNKYAVYIFAMTFMSFVSAIICFYSYFKKTRVAKKTCID